MPESFQVPRSPRDEIDGLIYFPRLCDKVRLQAAGTLSPGYHDNLGSGMDHWTCQFLGVDYDALAGQVRAGKSDADALAWARDHGAPRSVAELAWWTAFMKTRGFRDDLAQRLAQRKAESGFQDRADILTFMDYIDADEGRL
jgi:gluconokinase